MKAKLQLLERLVALILEAKEAGTHDPEKIIGLILEAKKKMNLFKSKNKLK
jgi:hypothetical protein